MKIFHEKKNHEIFEKFLPMFLNVVGVNVGVVSVGAPAADEQSICCSLRLSLLFPLLKLFEVMLKSSEKTNREKNIEKQKKKLTNFFRK